MSAHRAVSCRCGLPMAEGRKIRPRRRRRVARAQSASPEGAARGRARRRVVKVGYRRSRRIWDRITQATFRPTRRRAISGGGTPLGKPAAVRGSRERALPRRQLLSAGNRGAEAVVGEDIRREIPEAGCFSCGNLYYICWVRPCFCNPNYG